MGCNPVNVYLPQVTRIPISGPAPYNTLVCCTFGGISPALSQGGAGFVTRGQGTLWSNFVLAGFDQRTPPQFEHSTAAWLAYIGPGTADDTWLYSVDEISGAGFDPVGGRFFVNVDVAAMYAHWPSQFQQGLIEYVFEACVCSYVLVYEPPLPQSAPGAGRRPSPYRQYHQPANQLAGSLLPGAITARAGSQGSVFNAAGQLSGQAVLYPPPTQGNSSGAQGGSSEKKDCG
jgi:hypothetical protein